MESTLDAALAADAVTHFDLRPDNMIVGAEDAWICDWNWLQVRAPWFDTANFLVITHGGGHDAERLFWEHPTAADATGDRLDTALAAIVGYYLAQSGLPPIPGVSPHLRAHQRWTGAVAADWLARRRGWRSGMRERGPSR